MKEKLKEIIKGLLKDRKAAELSEFEQKRLAFADRLRKGYEAEPGEIINFLEGLSADGLDKLGRKIGFVERGQGVFDRRERLSEEPEKMA